MNKLILLLLLFTLALGSFSFIKQVQSGVSVGQTCVFGSPCCKKESDIDWSTRLAK